MSKAEHNQLARLGLAWKYAPHRLTSLWDMIELFAAGLAHNWKWLELEKYRFHEKAAKSPAEKPTQEEMHNLRAMLKTHNAPIKIGTRAEAIKAWLFYCDQLGMEKSKAALERFFEVLNVSNNIPNYSVVASQLNAFSNTLWRELFERRAVFIPERTVNFFEQDKLFGEAVYAAFPSLREEIKSAGNCLCVDLAEAAVFHLMRVMEFGLLLLHKKLCRKKPANPNWKNLIDKIENEIKDRDKISPRPALWKRQRSLYVECASHFYFFKDKRNREIHFEFPCDEYPAPSSAKALEIFNQVKIFMGLLATRLRE
jgi:hypothetical protein